MHKLNKRSIWDFFYLLKLAPMSAKSMSIREREICEGLLVEGKVKKHTSRLFGGVRYEWVHREKE